MLAAIKSFAREDREAAAYRFHVQRSMRLSIQEGRIHAVLEPLVGLIAAGAAVVLLFVAGRNVSAGTMSAPQLFSFLFYAALLTRPVAALAHLYGDFQSARGTLERLLAVLEEAIEPGYRAATTASAARGHVEFDLVSFAFPDRATVLDTVSIDIQAGDKVALVGDNGAGKTTLMNLLLRFIDPAGGVIRLDGCDIAALQVQDLRRQIGVVPQQAALFNGSIRANIAFGADDPDDAALLRAAQLAQADAFIAALPDGLDTEIGDHGVRLSGGERQRLSLARAIVKDPPILLLDEATSMFDLDGEAAFIEAGRMAFVGRTVIFTTHRPASLAIADRILRVGGGTVTEVAKNSLGDDDGN
jgi:ABC-type multidrug transport system fused ATPase/permease subunit